MKRDTQAWAVSDVPSQVIHLPFEQPHHNEQPK
jgi:hypothetical protein